MGAGFGHDARKLPVERLEWTSGAGDGKTIFAGMRDCTSVVEVQNQRLDSVTGPQRATRLRQAPSIAARDRNADGKRREDLAGENAAENSVPTRDQDTRRTHSRRFPLAFGGAFAHRLTRLT
jgi:hypothetical protein